MIQMWTFGLDSSRINSAARGGSASLSGTKWGIQHSPISWSVLGTEWYDRLPIVAPWSLNQQEKANLDMMISPHNRGPLGHVNYKTLDGKGEPIPGVMHPMYYWANAQPL